MKTYGLNYSVASLLKEGCRNQLWGKYDKPLSFNIIVNDMAEVQAHVATKYQFIGNPIRDTSALSYMSSSAPERMCKVAQVRSARG